LPDLEFPSARGQESPALREGFFELGDSSGGEEEFLDGSGSSSGCSRKNIFMAGVPLLLPLLGLVRAGEREEEEEEEDVRDEEKRRYGANTHRLSAFPCRGCGRRRMRDVHWDCMMERSCAEMI
jgi:hypothetical protein